MATSASPSQAVLRIPYTHWGWPNSAAIGSSGIQPGWLSGVSASACSSSSRFQKPLRSLATTRWAAPPRLGIQSGWKIEIPAASLPSEPAIRRAARISPCGPILPSQSWLRSQGIQGRRHSTQARWLPAGLSAA